MTDFWPAEKGVTASAEEPIAVTPSDTADLIHLSRGIMVNAPGNVVVSLAKGPAVTLTLLSGVLYPLRVKRVWSTGTTATGITAFL